MLTSISMVLVCSTALILIEGNPHDLALWGVLATGAVNLINSYLNRRADAKVAAQRHQWEMEDRNSKDRRANALVVENANAIRHDLAANTALTKTVGVKADAAFEAANHVNDKIANLARGPVQEITVVVADTNSTVHRLEEEGKHDS